MHHGFSKRQEIHSGHSGNRFDGTQHCCSRPLRVCRCWGDAIFCLNLVIIHSRWKGSPKPIAIPTQPRRSGQKDVRNPYLAVGAPNTTTTRTNATARQTLLNVPVAPRKTVRSIARSHLLPSSSSRTKGKGVSCCVNELCSQ